MRKIHVMSMWLLLGTLAPAAVSAATPEEMLQEAQRLEKAGSDQQAVKAYDAFLASYPDHSQATEALYRQARCLDNLGLVEQSVEKLQKVAKVDGKSFRARPEALYLLGKQYASLKDHKSACETYEKLLGEGAGLNEDEVLNLCAGWYAIQNRYQDAAAKFNILKRKKGTALAEQANYKIVLLWIKAEKLDDAVVAIQELSDAYPKSEFIPEVLLKVADSYRKAGKPDKTVSICAQLKANYPKTPEGLAATYLLGACQRDQKDHKTAVKTFEEVGKATGPQTRLIAADALCQAADIYRSELGDVPKALAKYEDAAALARETEGERRSQILEQCYFHLGEHYFVQKKWSTALEYYLQLRGLNTKINVLSRILACQAELKTIDTAQNTLTAADIEAIKKKIADNAGTGIAADAEVFLLDRRLTEINRTRGNPATLAAEYEKVAKAYAPEVLKKDGLDVYLLTQAGICYASGTTRAEYDKAIAAFNKAMALSKDNTSNRIACLENMAVAAERFGDKATAAKAYNDLYEIARANSDKAPDDKNASAKATEYLKALLTRADGKDAVEQALKMAQRVIDEKGPLSDQGRAAKFYIGELCYLKKDFSRAAREFTEFIRIYGPKQDNEGDVIGAPWQPAAMNEATDQLYEAAIRIAHAWHLQGHEQNMVKAYAWIARNFPKSNRYMPEVSYWLAMELGKGKLGETREGKKKLAEALWKGVVSTSLDFGARDFRKTFYGWVATDDERYEDAQQYVKSAILKAGQAFSECNDHESAAGAFQSYLDLYGPRRPGKRGAPASDGPDEMASIARYALGREYVALKSPTRLIEAYKPYTAGLRDDKFRVSALKLLGYHAGKAQMWDAAAEAYATLLDEYGVNRTDAKGNPVPLPAAERLRENTKGWNGIRMPMPKDLNTGEIRYALGFLYWNREDYARCVTALKPFLAEPGLRHNAFREKALFMAGQSCFKVWDYAAGTPFLVALIREHPNFEACEEAYVYAARGLAETKAQNDLEVTYQNFLKTWPRSERRQRMDIAYATGLLAAGKADKAQPIFRALADGEVYEDVKADAWYGLGLITLRNLGDKGTAEAARQFEKSVSIYAREASCLEAAKANHKLKAYDKAKGFLERMDREFSRGNPRILEEGKALGALIEKERMKSGKG